MLRFLFLICLWNYFHCKNNLDMLYSLLTIISLLYEPKYDEWKNIFKYSNEEQLFEYY